MIHLNLLQRKRQKSEEEKTQAPNHSPANSNMVKGESCQPHPDFPDNIKKGEHDVRVTLVHREKGRFQADLSRKCRCRNLSDTRETNCNGTHSSVVDTFSGRGLSEERKVISIDVNDQLTL